MKLRILGAEAESIGSKNWIPVIDEILLNPNLLLTSGHKNDMPKNPLIEVIVKPFSIQFLVDIEQISHKPPQKPYLNN